MFQLPEIHGAAGGLANVKGWAKNWRVWENHGGVWAKIEKVGKECMFVGKGVISLGKENFMMDLVSLGNLCVRVCLTCVLVRACMCMCMCCECPCLIPQDSGLGALVKPGLLPTLSPKQSTCLFEHSLKLRVCVCKNAEKCKLRRGSPYVCS